MKSSAIWNMKRIDTMEDQISAFQTDQNLSSRRSLIKIANKFLSSAKWLNGLKLEYEQNFHEI